MKGGYDGTMGRREEIIERSCGLDYETYEREGLRFDYEHLMRTGYSIDRVQEIGHDINVGETPLVELTNITKLVRSMAPKGKGARLFVKDEATNPSKSYKDRRALLNVYHAEREGYDGVIAATSGNYGAAVASQAAKRGLDCIVVQEVFDSKGRGQPEILEKTRACEAYGAEVIQLSVGPELFYKHLELLEETGFFNASLYTPWAVAGVEPLGWEIATEVRERTGRQPDAVFVTHAGGGNLTGTARGLRAADCDATVVGVSVNLEGLSMASDTDFNRKSFTTGHTGFGIPFLVEPDRSDVPRSAARALRYIDRYCTVEQGEVFYVTEMLAQLEGIERGPAGNTSLAAAIPVATRMDEDGIVVVQETEYTGAGKHPTSQLTFARELGVEITRGPPDENIPGEVIAIPEHPSQLRAATRDLDAIRTSYLRRKAADAGEDDIDFLVTETGADEAFVREMLSS